ncbi:MAG TPA: TolC family protein [Candidatus Sulfotelmatobacter sp.]|nr:TolC family protein [Candidatus Sulfotelmatobacter sp.]
MACAIAGAAMMVAPLMAVQAQEPPQPNSAPRGAVEKGPQVKKGDIPPAKDVPAKELEAKPADAPAGADGGDVEAGTRKGSTLVRGKQRADLLKKLMGDGDVTLEKDEGNPPSVVEPLTMPEAVAFALKNNYGVQAAHATSNASKWDKVAAYGSYLPTVNLEYKDGKEENKPASYQVYNSTYSTGVTVKDDTHHAWSNSLTVTQPVIDPLLIATILQRSDTMDAVEADELSTREKTAYDALVSFLRVTRSRLTIGFAENYKRNLDKLAQRMRDRVSGGGAPGVELDRITARSVTASSAIIQAHSEYQAAITEFRRLTGVSPIKLRLPDILMPTVPGNLEEVLTRTLKNNPDFRAANKRADAAIGDMNASFANLLPRFNVEFSDTRTWNVGGVAKTDIKTCPSQGSVYYNCIEPYTHNTTLMGVFTWTLNGGYDFSTGMGNRSRAEAASFNANDTRQKLEEAVRNGYDAMNAANDQIDADGRAVEANSKVAVAFEEQYLAGSRQLLDLLDAYERLYTSQNELTSLLVAEAQAAYLLRNKMGELQGAILSPDQPE